ncbi:two-component system NtrC family sensor kinase [Desulfobotulus alkaliphilus]|uniref:histidine kinase n=1 Tax=Desulfobotulus alkaliphilus TaxID=622671 RepID=A0A562RZ03_9BACT|nr:PAS domain-containing sensor histidine kinase [Desulfobotulus alkaliphilus]TWI74138.1 two-component system NtrC family sensor kinase [Desulfobotulus alkaliphilus]
MFLRKLWHKAVNSMLTFPEDSISPHRYVILKRNIILIMCLVCIIPLALMAGINYSLYRANLESEILRPIQVMAEDTRHAFELFIEERLSTVRFIAHAYTYDELHNEKTLQRVLRTMRSEFVGFVDLGLINQDGILVSYAGPYKLLGKDYSQQPSFQEASVRGVYISDVFMGYRKFPHVVIAVQRMAEDGSTWFIRATLDTGRYEALIASMALRPEFDAFLVNPDGILQTNARFYGKILEESPFDIPPGIHGTHTIKTIDPAGKEVLVAFAPVRTDYTLVLVKPLSVLLRSFYAMKVEMLIIFGVGVVAIILAVVGVADVLVQRIRNSDEKRATAIQELQHTQKLSSIGRLAAGVAHEINNPLAIINEKAGLMQDLVGLSEPFERQDRFMALTDNILQSVERCRTITHRLLGFARRIDVQFEKLDLNGVLRDTLGFLEREASYRQIEMQLLLSPELPPIVSDKGQLQQVFLNILTNAFAAVENGGCIKIRTRFEIRKKKVLVSIEDNGCGMDEEIRKHIFDPFFSTKKGSGTGLGLSITYGIINKLGGTIQVNSKEGEGSTFTISLPLKGNSKSSEAENPADEREKE